MDKNITAVQLGVEESAKLMEEIYRTGYRRAQRDDIIVSGIGLGLGVGALIVLKIVDYVKERKEKKSTSSESKSK